MKNLLIRTITGILIVSLVVAGIVIDKLTLLLLMEIVFLLGSFELARMISVKTGIYSILSVVSGSIVIACSYLINIGLINPLWILIPGILLVPLLCNYKFNPKPVNRSTLIFYLLAIFWLAVPLSLFLSLGWAEEGGSYHFRLPLILIALTWINDTFAYLTGSLIGKHKMTPILSPGKTWEGFFGGLVFTMLSGWLIYRFIDFYSTWIWILISAVIVLFGLLGDLSESKLKRIYKLKNSGSLLPGHGGILDRFDSLLFAASAVYFVLLIINSGR